MAGDQAQVRGLEDFKRAAVAIPAALRKRVLRNALAAGARLVRDEARRNAPVLSLGNQLKAPYRKPGTVRKAIVVRTSKANRRAGDVGVFVNVKPAKKGGRGAKNPADPFYWRWLEFGTERMRARPFLQPATARLRDALGVFETKIADWLKSVNNKGPIA